MFDFHEKRKIKGYLYSRYAVVGLFLLSALLSVSVYERYVAERKMAAKREDIADELDSLKQRAAVLQTEVERLRSDRGIEEEIRDRYEVSKKGEQVVVILGNDIEKKENVATSSSREIEAEGGFWSKWWP